MAGEAKTGQLGNDQVTGGKVAADTLDLTDIGTKLTQALGVPGKGWITQSGFNIAAGDTYQIGAVTFTFAAAEAAPEDIAPGGAGPWAPNVAIARAVIRINAHATCVAEAAAFAGNDGTSAGLHLCEKAVTGAGFALVATVAAGGSAVSAAASTGEALAADKTVFHGAYALTAADITALALLNGAAAVIGEVDIGSIGSTASPAYRITDVYTAAGVKIADNTLVYKWVQHDGNLWSLVVMDPVAVLAATNVINWLAIS